MQTHTFLFHLSNDFFTVPPSKPRFMEVTYEVFRGNAVLNDDSFHVPATWYPYLKENYRMYDQVCKAANNNAESMGVLTAAAIEYHRANI